MNEEMKNYEELEEVETDVTVEIVDETEVEPEESGTGIGGYIALGLLALAGVAVYAFHKTKAKREARTIRNLEKKGYVVYTIDEVSDCRECAEDEDSCDKEDVE